MQLKRLASKLELTADVSFPGFVQYDGVSDLFYATDISHAQRHTQIRGPGRIPTVIMEASCTGAVIATDVSE